MVLGMEVFSFQEHGRDGFRNTYKVKLLTILAQTSHATCVQPMNVHSIDLHVANSFRVSLGVHAIGVA